MVCPDGTVTSEITGDDIDSSLQNFDIIGYPTPEDFIEGKQSSSLAVGRVCALIFTRLHAALSIVQHT